LDPSGVARVVADETNTDTVAILEDVEVGDKAIVAHVAVGRCVIVLSDLAQVFFEVGNGVLKAGHLSGVLGGPGLDGECEAVNELTELCSGDVGMGVEGGQNGMGGQRRNFGDRGPSWQRW